MTSELLRWKDVDIYETNNHGLNAIEQVFDEGLSEQSALGIIARSDVLQNWFEKPLKVSTASLRCDSVEDLIFERAPSKAILIDQDRLYLLAPGRSEQRIRDKNGKFPIHLAAEQGHPTIVSLLLKSSMEDVGIFEVDNEGRRSLHYFVMCGILIASLASVSPASYPESMSKTTREDLRRISLASSATTMRFQFLWTSVRILT
ncbi:hypothetical protein HD806DRAFT_548272 [Xylariaceae sp. AK1471]|nr:hypothetical protein HD806DRAFT_548272 [Xylariaceae sp. AK1471]